MNKNHNSTELKQIIDACDNLLIISHILPDGDNIGSTIALMLMLKAKGKQVTAIVNGQMPPYYRFLTGSIELVPTWELAPAVYDAVICVDMSDHDRGGEVWPKIQGKPILVNIDHHISNDYFGDYNYVKSDASSAAEVVTELFVAWGEPFSKEIAEALYTAMITDSGSFTYPSTSAHTMRMAALLLEHRPDLGVIRENVLENVSFKRKKLLAAALSDAVLDSGGKLCYGAIPYETIQTLEAKGPDFENIIDHLIGVSGVEYAVLFREIEPGVVKVGFRGKRDNDVTVVAAQFGGGGHKAAAGCSCNGSLREVTDAVIGAARGYLEAE